MPSIGAAHTPLLSLALTVLLSLAAVVSAALRPDATNALGAKIEVTSADGLYRFHLTADVLEGRMHFGKGVKNGEEYSTVSCTFEFGTFLLSGSQSI